MENCFLPFPVKNETKFDYIEAFEEYLMSSFDANIIDKILFNIWCHHAIQYSGLDLGKGHNPRSEGFRRILGIPTFGTLFLQRFLFLFNDGFRNFQKTSKVFEGIVSAPKKCIFLFCDRSISKPNFLLQFSPPNI